MWSIRSEGLTTKHGCVSGEEVCVIIILSKMPSASAKNGNVIPPINVPDLLHEPLKNVVCVLDKKLRNLEKRKVSLDSFAFAKLEYFYIL